MNLRNLTANLGWLCFSLVLANARAGMSQEGFRPVETADMAVVEDSETELANILSKGRSLESAESWGEALTHYEESVRRFRESDVLKQRMHNARLHFDLTRRYRDDSFRQNLRNVSLPQALDLYGEVTLKVQSNYVHEPDWNATLRSGLEALRIALKDSEFRETNRVDVDPKVAESLIGYVEGVFRQRNVQDRRHAQDLVKWVATQVNRRLGVQPTAVVMEFLCGATSSLDAYSTYLTANQLDEVYSQIEGNFVGLGIELKADGGSLLIDNVIPEGPADRAGMLAGERIVGVDGVKTKDVSTDRAADMLKGEQGTYVRVTLLANDGVTTRQLQVRRERVEVPSVEDVRIVDEDTGVGYFRISSFQKTTSRDVDAALWKLHRAGMRSLIVDVRGNPGGLLNEAVEVADRFVLDGKIVATQGRSVRENYDYKAHSVGTWRVPLVVLIDGDSASASEIFAGAIRDHRRGPVVGDRSYGKGSVQGIFPLRVVKGGIRLTTAKFYSPSGKAISDWGVEPDVRVHTVARPTLSGQQLVSTDDDEVLAAGTRIARDLIASRLKNAEAERAAQVNRSRRLPRATANW